jgi:DNA (cytosine-5)-methyltransferase 1
MTRPLLLDLFCGAGGAAAGYHRAGFDVIGVDNRPQPHYPFTFIQADALDVLCMIAAGKPLQGRYPDAIHASPVCLGFARVTDWRGDRGKYPDTLTPALELLPRTGIPWVVENVQEAPLRPDYLLCGSQFGLAVRRHRVFQTSWGSAQLTAPCWHHGGLLVFEHKQERAYAEALGCGWMTNREARQAIPPAYTEYLGGDLMREVAGQASDGSDGQLRGQISLY